MVTNKAISKNLKLFVRKSMFSKALSWMKWRHCVPFISIIKELATKLITNQLYFNIFLSLPINTNITHYSCLITINKKIKVKRSYTYVELLCFPRKMGKKERNGFTFSSLSPWVSGSTPSPNHFLFTVFKDLHGKTQINSKIILCYFIPQI